VRALGWTALLALAAAAGCARRAPDPLPAEAAGWSKGRTRSFAAAELWRYVNGDAERYLQAGVVRTLTAEYRSRNGSEAVADVHEMSAPEGARRLFESEPAAGSRAIQVGEAGRSYGPSLTFRRGRYFVRLVAYQDSAEIAEALIALARAVDARLRGAP
jgi:hypothetical protein